MMSVCYKFFSVSLGSFMLLHRDICLPSICFLSPCEFFASPLKSQVTTPTSSFVFLCFSLKMVYELRASVILVSYECFSRFLSYVYVIKLLLDFSPLNMLHINLILRPARGA